MFCVPCLAAANGGDVKEDSDDDSLGSLPGPPRRCQTPYPLPVLVNHAEVKDEDDLPTPCPFPNKEVPPGMHGTGKTLCPCDHVFAPRHNKMRKSIGEGLMAAGRSG